MRGLARLLRGPQERGSQNCVEVEVRSVEEIDREIRKLEEKYGMSYEEFYEHIESDISKLTEKFDPEEVMDDLARLIALIDAKEKLTGERIFDRLSEY